MIRKLVDWLLYKLHIKSRDGLAAIECVNQLIPILFVVMVLTSIFRSMRGILPKLPWHAVVWFWIRSYVRRARAIVIGY